MYEVPLVYLTSIHLLHIISHRSPRRNVIDYHTHIYDESLPALKVSCSHKESVSTNLASTSSSKISTSIESLRCGLENRRRGRDRPRGAFTSRGKVSLSLLLSHHTTSLIIQHLSHHHTTSLVSLSLSLSPSVSERSIIQYLSHHHTPSITSSYDISHIILQHLSHHHTTSLTSSYDNTRMRQQRSNQTNHSRASHSTDIE